MKAVRQPLSTGAQGFLPTPVSLLDAPDKSGIRPAADIGGLSYPGSYQAVYGVIQYGTGENWSDQQTVGFSYVP